MFERGINLFYEVMAASCGQMRTCGAGSRRIGDGWR